MHSDTGIFAGWMQSAYVNWLTFFVANQSASSTEKLNTPSWKAFEIGRNLFLALLR